jgi:hypothetical protein
MYEDNGRTAAASKAKVDADYAVVLDLFQKAGFTIAFEKSDSLGASAQRKEYLGLIIDMNSMTDEVLKQKMARICKLLDVFLGAIHQSLLGLDS